MRLIPLWEADEQRAYDLQMSFRPEENGFINSAYGLSRQAFSGYVQLRKRNSQGLDLPEGYVPDTVYVLENDEGGYVGIVNLRHCARGRATLAMAFARNTGAGATPQRPWRWPWRKRERLSRRKKFTFPFTRTTPPP